MTGLSRPLPGGFCETHFSWLCQARQGRCAEDDIERLNEEARQAHEAGDVNQRDKLLDLAAAVAMESGLPSGRRYSFGESTGEGPPFTRPCEPDYIGAPAGRKHWEETQREDGWLLRTLEEQAGPLSDYLKDPDDEDPFDEAWVREEAKE